MARHPRIEFPGALYHVFTRGNNRQPIFADDEDRRVYLSGLCQAHTRLNATIYAYCLVDNHVHHLMETADVPLCRVMQSILTRYARYFNIRHNRTGHLFQGRYRAIICQKEKYLLELVRYIHLNPVRAQLVKLPEDWQWSSHNAYLGNESVSWLETKSVLEIFHNKEVGKARRLYEQFVLDALGRQPDTTLSPSKDTAVIGGGEFQALARRMTAKLKRRREDLPSGRIRLNDILEKVANRHGYPLSALRRASRESQFVRARNEALYEAASMGWPHVEIARAFRRKESWVTHTLRRWREKNVAVG